MVKLSSDWFIYIYSYTPSRQFLLILWLYNCNLVVCIATSGMHDLLDSNDLSIQANYISYKLNFYISRPWWFVFSHVILIITKNLKPVKTTAVANRRPYGCLQYDIIIIPLQRTSTLFSKVTETKTTSCSHGYKSFYSRFHFTIRNDRHFSPNSITCIINYRIIT